MLIKVAQERQRSAEEQRKLDKFYANPELVRATFEADLSTAVSLEKLMQYIEVNNGYN